MGNGASTQGAQDLKVPNENKTVFGLEAMKQKSKSSQNQQINIENILKKYEYKHNEKDISIVEEIQELSKLSASKFEEKHILLRNTEMHTFLHNRLCFDPYSLEHSFPDNESAIEFITGFSNLMNTSGNLSQRPQFFLTSLAMQSGTNGLLTMLHMILSNSTVRLNETELEQYSDFKVKSCKDVSDMIKSIASSSLLKNSNIVSTSWLNLETVILQLGLLCLPDFNRGEKAARAAIGRSGFITCSQLFVLILPIIVHRLLLNKKQLCVFTYHHKPICIY